MLRLWVASQDYRTDITVSEERLKKVSETYRGIRNTLRYQLSNLYDFDPAQHTVPDAQLTGLDKWVLRKLNSVEVRVQQRYDAYEFHIVYQILSQFAAVELSAFYHDVCKDRLYTLAANHPKRRSTQTTLHRLVTGLCKMLSPILAFTADEAWEFIPSKETPSSHLAVWVPPSELVELDPWDNLHALRLTALPELEKARKEANIGKSLEAEVVWEDNELSPAFQIAIKHSEDFQEILGVSKLTLLPVPSPDGTPSLLKRITVRHAPGQKCERCWHWETTVGASAEHPTICPRCIEAVKQCSPS